MSVKFGSQLSILFALKSLVFSNTPPSRVRYQLHSHKRDYLTQLNGEYLCLCNNPG